MLNEKNIKEITEQLPEKWEEKAQELGALKRIRKIKNAISLLMLILLYATSGKSIGGTSRT